MKAKLVSQLDLSPTATPEQVAQSTTIQRTVNGRLQAVRILPVGAIVERPDAWQLVRIGVADPADAECVEAAGMTQEQIKAAQQAQRRAAAGIHPKDFADFDAGLFIGYDPRGNRIPPPKPTDGVHAD